MAGANCSLTCNVKDRTGNVKVSALWEELTKYFKGDRREAVTHYFLTKDSNFLMENSDVLEFDTNGEVTLESLKKAMERDGEYSKLSNAKTLEHLNRELAKEVKAQQVDYSTALDNVLKFNRSNQFREGFMATLNREENGKYSVKVVERNSQTEYELADHVQNKILTDALRLVLKNRGLSVEFLDNPSYAVQYSTHNAHMDADGLMAVANVLNGKNTSSEVAEAAGHFIVASMQESPLIQRLMEQLTPEVQTAIFKGAKSELAREDFIVSESSAKEAAGILVGRQLLQPFRDAQVSKAAKIGNAIPKAIKWLLNKIGTLAKKVLGIYTPDQVAGMVQRAKEMAATAAEGYIANPEDSQLMQALENPDTFTSDNVSKRLSDEVKRNVRAYYDTLGSLKDMISRLKLSTGRADSPINKDILSHLKILTKGVSANYSSQMSQELFAKRASIEGMIVALEGITQILDTDIRNLLDQIQPSDRIQSYASTASNARNMRTVNTAIKSIAELYLTISDKLDTLSAADQMQFQDADGNQVVTTLRETVKRLGDVLTGNEETYTDLQGQEQQVNGIQKVLELKRRQLFIDAMREFWGNDFIEMNAGKVWQQKGWKHRLVTSGNRKVEVQDLIDSMDEDISWFDRYLGSAADCGDFVTSIGYKVTRESNMRADRLAAMFWDRLEELRLQMQDVFGTTDCTQLYEEITDEEGHRFKTGNLVSRVNYGAWEKARAEFKQQLKRDFNEYLANLKKKAYENNKGRSGYIFSLSDNQRAVLYHNFIDPQWKKWHEENSELDKSIHVGKRYLPNSIKYHNTQWDALFDTENPSLSEEERAARKRRLQWYNTFMELKDAMDSMLPPNATVRWRAPQMTGRFSHRFRNLRAQMDNSKAAFGHALRKKIADFLVVRPDEAYLFGSNNEFNEITEDPLENPMFFEKEKINRLPLFGINKLKDMEDLSTDLFGTMMQYGSMAATYNAMERVVDIFELGRDVLKQRKVGNKTESNRESESRAYARYAKFLEKNIYGINVTAPSWDKNGMWRKLANNLSSIGGRILLWGNVPGGIVNTGTGMFEMFKEAVAGENFNMADIAYAHDTYFNEIMKTMGMGLIDKQRPDDFNSLWIRHWNILSENRDFLRNQKFDANALNMLDNRLWEWFNKTMMLPYSSGEHYMQTIPFYAMGNKIRVYDKEGNSMKLMDAYEIVDGREVFAIDDENAYLGKTPKKIRLKREIFRSAADINTYNTVQGMMERIANFKDNHPNARNTTPIGLDFFSKEEREYLADEGFAVPENVKQLLTLNTALQGKASELVYNETDESAFMDKCRNICNRLHGIYNTEDKVTFQQNFYGSLVMAMRGYALGMTNRRLADSRFNVPQGKVVEGSYNTAFKVLMSAFYDIHNMDNWKAVGEAFLLAAPYSPTKFLLFNKAFGDKTRADMIKAGFSEHQYYNMRRAGADFLVIEALTLMKLLSAPGSHAGLDDKEDEDKSKGTDTSDNILAGLIYYFANRWDREQEAFNTPRGIWNEATSLLDYVPVGFSGAKAIWDIAALFVETQADALDDTPDYTDSDLYYQGSKKGKYEKGDAKWKAKFLRLCPYIRSWYTFSHPYDAAAGFEYGRRVRGK